MRHEAVKLGLNMRSDGFVEVDELMELGEIKSNALLNYERIRVESHFRRYLASC